MSYPAMLRESARRTGSIACLGLDPVRERIPIDGDDAEAIAAFCIAILDACAKEGCLPGAVKPNSAFYEQHGAEGMRALERVIAHARQLGLPVILDAKRADIGATSAAYARAAYDALGADAVTLAPYMGMDSLQPFLDRCANGKGAYVLVRTSNPGAKDFQDLRIGAHGEPLYLHVARALLAHGPHGAGAVVGATYPEELASLARLLAASGQDVPLLIPGAGTQGGSPSAVVRTLKDAGYDLSLCRINSSSGITYAYEKEGTRDYAGAAVRALRRLNQEIGNWE